MPYFIQTVSKTQLTLPGEPFQTELPESVLMDHTWLVLPVWGKETRNTKPSYVTGTETEASDKDGRDTSVTNRPGQATPRCQTAMSIRQSRAALAVTQAQERRPTWPSHGRVEWQTIDNKMNLFIQV